jgi:hypothetical protein
MRKFVPVMEYNSTFLLQFLYQWRKPLLALPLVAGLLGAVASSSWFIMPLYKSSVIVFPATTNSVSKVLLPQTSFSEDDMLAFGAEEQAEQLIQILNSDEIFELSKKRQRNPSAIPSHTSTAAAAAPAAGRAAAPGRPRAGARGRVTALRPPHDVA